MTGSDRMSTVGRPRVLTDEHVRQILEWHDAVLAWRATRGTLKTLRQLAKELGVPPGTVYNVVRRRGEFKLAAPKRRYHLPQVGRADNRKAPPRDGRKVRL